MDNQHKMIKGYRDLSAEEIAAMNKVKEAGAAIGQLVDELKVMKGLDQRWISIGATDLQKGFMSLTRGVAQPTTF
jgi:hypothetical protein